MYGAGSKSTKSDVTKSSCNFATVNCIGIYIFWVEVSDFMIIIGSESESESYNYNWFEVWT